MRREVWRLTEGLVFAHFAVYLLTSTQEGSWRALALIPGSVVEKPWTLLTYQFIHGGMISFFFSMLVLFIMARPLENEWGSFRFLMFWLVSCLGAAGTAVLLGQPLAGDMFLSASLLFTFATVYPDTEFRLYFLIPVKVKYLAIIAACFLVFNSFRFGPLFGLVNVVGMSAGYVFFLVIRRIPSRRKLAHELKKRRAQVEIATESASLQRRNTEWDARVRAAEERAHDKTAPADEDLPLLAELDAARDGTISVCGPGDFGYVEDDVCRACGGFPECAARAIRLAAESAETET
ncbi:MAG: rhomboid family intramembrane serine protease [bacterium]|nr:rhomboid family intramembrane serine protease [bacterium]